MFEQVRRRSRSTSTGALVRDAMTPVEYFRRDLHKNLRAMELLGHPVSPASTSSSTSTERSTTTPDSPSVSRSTSAPLLGVLSDARASYPADRDPVALAELAGRLAHGIAGARSSQSGLR
jgi:hypothetical protein